jgi:tetratricopeptide (TPR) repeat protein
MIFMRSFFLVLSLGCSLSVWAQSSSTPASSSPANPQTPGAGSAPADKPDKPGSPNLAPPRSDSVNAGALDAGESSSKDTQIDLSPPADDAKAHPLSAEAVSDAEGSDSGDVSEFHPWDPHKAAKDVEVGDFYFKRKNYIGAESRYREALLYKDNDAIATFHLAVCLEKMGRPDEARKEYESYLKILPHGPEAEAAQRAIGRLQGAAGEAKPAK